MSYYSLADITVYVFMLLILAAAYQDVKRFTLPNTHSLGVAILYPAFVLASPDSIDWLSAVLVATAALSIGFVLFALKFCGGGDAKLIAAISLWAGPALVIDFILLTAISGGAIALGYFIHHQISIFVPFLPQGMASNSKTLSKKSMPYGVAIAIGALYVAFTLLG